MNDPSNDARTADCALSRRTTVWETYGRRRYATLFYALLFILVAETVSTTFRAQRQLNDLSHGKLLASKESPTTKLPSFPNSEPLSGLKVSLTDGYRRKAHLVHLEWRLTEEPQMVWLA